MIAKEKALELVNKYTRLVPEHFGGMDKELAKQCAIVCVDEILKTKGYTGNKLIDSDTYNYLEVYEQMNWDYWQQVKKEIENL